MNNGFGRFTERKFVPIVLVLALVALALVISLPVFHQHLPTDSGRCLFHLIEKNVMALQNAVGISSPSFHGDFSLPLADDFTPEQYRPFSRIPRAPPGSSV